MTDDHLIGWLCIMRLNWGADNRFNMPTEVRESLEKKGWIECHPAHGARLTDAGAAITDLHAGEWGIDAVNTEDQSEIDEEC